MTQQNSSKSKYDSVEQLKKLFSHGYVVNRSSYPSTRDETSSIMIDFIQSKHREDCLISSLSGKKEKGEIVE
jgi:hypothetical protein